MRVFVLGALLALALVSGAVAEDARNVNIVNETGYGIKFLGFNNPGDDDWSDNELGSVLRNRGSVYVKVQHRRRRMRMEFKDRMGGPGLSRRAVERRGFVQDQNAAAALQQVHRHGRLTWRNDRAVVRERATCGTDRGGDVSHGHTRAGYYVFHGGCVLKRARRNFTSALMSASDSCEPNAGMERPSAPVGGLMPFRMTSTTLSETGA
jgi:hypothetical protein